MEDIENNGSLNMPTENIQANKPEENIVELMKDLKSKVKKQEKLSNKYKIKLAKKDDSIIKKIKSFNTFIFNLAELNNFEGTKLDNPLEIDKFFYINNCNKLNNSNPEDLDIKILVNMGKLATPDLNIRLYSQKVKDYIDMFVTFCKTSTIIQRKPRVEKQIIKEINMYKCKKCGHKFEEYDILSLKKEEELICPDCGKKVAIYTEMNIDELNKKAEIDKEMNDTDTDFEFEKDPEEGDIEKIEEELENIDEEEDDDLDFEFEEEK